MLEAWWNGSLDPSGYFGPLPIFWWARIGKLTAVISAAILVVELVGLNRMNALAVASNERRQEYSGWLRERIRARVLNLVRLAADVILALLIVGMLLLFRSLVVWLAPGNIADIVGAVHYWYGLALVLVIAIRWLRELGVWLQVVGIFIAQLACSGFSAILRRERLSVAMNVASLFGVVGGFCLDMVAS